MVEPVSERIMALVRERVATAFEAYRSTRIATWQPKDQVTHVFQGNVIANDAISYPGNPPAKGWTLEAAIAGIAKPSDRDITPIDTFKNRLAADIIGAITEPELWHQWNGLAINTVFDMVEDFTGTDGGASGVIVRMNVHYRTDENNLYNVRA
jgi:hypothetical protein